MKRPALIIAVILASFGQAPAQYSGTAATRFSFTKTMMGVPGQTTGTITFQVDPGKGSFTCLLQGNGQLSGTANWGVPHQITATIELSSTSCSGRFYPQEGTIDGNISMLGAYRSTATYRSDQGKMKSETESGSETNSGSIYGNLGPGGRGKVETDDGTFNWEVTRPLSQPATIEEEPLPDEEQPAPAVEQPSAQLEPEPEAEVVNEFIKDSLEFSGQLMNEYKEYRTQGGELRFSAYLAEQYPDPKQREQAETAIRVAAKEKERRKKEIDVYVQSARQTASQVVTRYHDEAMVPAAAGNTEPATFNEWMTGAIPDPGERNRLSQAAVFSVVDAYSAAGDNYKKLVEKMSDATAVVDKIWKAAPAKDDTRENWLKQQAQDFAQGKAFDKVREMMPEQLTEKADQFYEKFSGWKEKYDSAKELKQTADQLKEKNKKLFELYDQGKLDATGVQGLRAVNLLETVVNSGAVPDFSGYKEVWKEGLGKAVKFGSDFLVYKTSARSLVPDSSDETMKRFEDSRSALKKYGEGEAHNKYDDKNMFIEFFKNPFGKKETPPEKLKYH